MEQAVAFIARGKVWPIVLHGDHPTAQLAASELQGYLQRISDRAPDIMPTPPADGAPHIALQYAAGAGDGFVRQVAEDGIRLIGRSPRGLLFGVYDLLEELGCRWYYPGAMGERIPRHLTVMLPAGIKDEVPRLAGRGLILGHELYLAEVADWIAWAARNRLNYVFFHPFPPPSWGGQYEKAYQRVRREAAEALRLRSMTLEYGGHLLSTLLPRWLFRRHREAFRFAGSRRTADYNLCPANPFAIATIRQQAARFFEAHPEVDVFHIWPDDIAGGGWCACPTCADLSASDQALLIINEIADVLHELRPDALISFLAYHDTRFAPKVVKPRRNVALLYAPRERCYAHTLNDRACSLNLVDYEPSLRQQVAWFADSGWPEHQVFEYYLDGILFKSMAPPLANLLPADLHVYADAGCQHVGTIITADRPWLTPPVNAFLFAQLAWHPRPQEELLEDFVANYYGGPVETLLAYQQQLEIAFHLLLDLSPEEVQPEESSQSALPKDVLDFMEAPLEARRARLAALQQARQHLENAAAHLAAAMRPGAGTKPPGRVTRGEVLNRELDSLQLMCLQFDFLYYRQLAYCLAGERAGRREIAPAVRQAEASLRAILAWGDAKIADRRWRQQFRLAHRPWQQHVQQLRRTALAWWRRG